MLLTVSKKWVASGFSVIYINLVIPGTILHSPFKINELIYFLRCQKIKFSCTQLSISLNTFLQLGSRGFHLYNF